jgi:hypothetical protein
MQSGELQKQFLQINAVSTKFVAILGQKLDSVMGVRTNEWRVCGHHGAPFVRSTSEGAHSHTSKEG